MGHLLRFQKEQHAGTDPGDDVSADAGGYVQHHAAAGCGDERERQSDLAAILRERAGWSLTDHAERDPYPMIQANNGILICVLMMWLGVHIGDGWLMGGAILLSALSYLVNLGNDDVPVLNRLADSLFVVVVLLGVALHAYAAVVIMRML